MHTIINSLKNAPTLRDVSPKLHRDNTLKKVFIQSCGIAALCKRNRPLGERSVGKQTHVWLHKNKCLKSMMIKVFH